MITIKKRDKGIDKTIIEKLSKKYDTTKEIISLLLNRGYKKETLDKYLQNNEFYTVPFNSITNLDEAVKQIITYLEDDKAEIYVYADYDADGVNAGYILTDVLKAIKESIESKCKIDVHFPNRNEGYGLSMNFCKRIAPRKTKKKILVITVDNGITKKEEVAYLQSKGVEVIVTDHHAPKKDEVPDCLVVDPWLNDLKDENAKGLCGAAIAYKVAGRLLEMYEDDTNFILNYLPNAAIATITDMMPATPENIGMVEYGLWLIEEGYSNIAIQHYKNYKNSKLKVKDIAFEIGPQINACGRMGNIELASDFMFSYDEDEVNLIYNEMITVNDERKDLEKEILNEIIGQEEAFKNDLMIVLNVPKLGGLGGTVASKVIDLYGKPCILLTGNGEVLHGSARTYGSLDLHALFKMEVAKGNLVNFGGHNAAAGVSVHRDKVDALRKSLNKTLAQLMLEYVDESEYVDEDITIEVDDIIHLNDIRKSTYAPYENLLYFGDLKEPMFAITNLNVIESRSSSNNANHLCLNVEDETCKGTKNRYGKIVGKEIWAWNKMGEYKRLGEPSKVHLIGRLEPDFRNPKFYTFSIDSIVPAC